MDEGITGKRQLLWGVTPAQRIAGRRLTLNRAVLPNRTKIAQFEDSLERLVDGRRHDAVRMLANKQATDKGNAG